MSSVKKICTTAFCIALCYVLPLLFHAMALGMAFSPLHLPVLLCGLLCGWPYGALCGIAGHILSSVLSSMPAASQLIYMCPELCVYGLVAGLGMQFIRSGRSLVDIYLSLLPAMVLGRVVGGVVRAAFFLANAQSYSVAMWASAYVVGTMPAIIMQLVVLPVLVLALTRAGLVPRRYAGSSPAI